MRVSLQWLHELLPTLALEKMSLADFTSRLDLTGTGVEGVITSGQTLDGVMVGRVLVRDPHPNADALWLCKVDVGGAEPLQIVCGAQNFKAGDKVPVATVGATLPGGVVIKKSKLRGEVSEGMNCSARELGVGEDYDGLLILPEDAPVGAPFAQYYGLADTILDLEITPNRPDCLSMRGIAREFGAIFGADPAPLPAGELVEAGTPAADIATVSIEDPAICARYTARVIRNVKIGPSPAWLAARVETAGARSINNIVDITNLVMFETGQPLHAFDLDTITKDASGRAAVIVRRATEGERITTLDGQDRILASSNTLIADPAGPITLGGVMGALHTEISESTTNVFLEAAVFDPETTSRTSRRLSLLSEASMRFERGVDRVYTPTALTRAATLMAELAGGTVAPGIIDVYPLSYEAPQLTLRHERLISLIGEEIPFEACVDILRRLELQPQANPATKTITVTVPAFRPDLEREVDLIEECLRLWGMERVTSVLPGAQSHAGGLSPAQQLERRVGEVLRASGVSETMTLPLGDPADYAAMGRSPSQESPFVELHNPMSSEQSILRESLVPNLLHSVAHNLAHGVTNVQLYEIGSVFSTAPGRRLPREQQRGCVVLTGAWHDARWNDPAVPLDFYDAKGIYENLVSALRIEKIQFKPPADDRAYPWLQPGRAAEIHLGGSVAGVVGELHPALREHFDIDAPVSIFDFDLRKFIKAASTDLTLTAPTRYPGIKLDLALIVDADATAQSLIQRITALAKKTPLSSVELFDVYTGKGIEPGKKSLAFHLYYSDPERTLSAEEVEAQHSKLLQALLAQTGARLR
ncbi:MAG: phenylalanine--tRNA ligase subunit beta [Actinomycetia bacterium]|nr:phenylalanine--tRNA ligase subunit beta [Actinomycetes bacterium]